MDAEGIRCQSIGSARDRHPGQEQASDEESPMDSVITAGDGPAPPGPIGRGPNGTGFADLGLGAGAMQAVESLGYRSPTAVQELAIPILLAGRDLGAPAPTGARKTAAYRPPLVDGLAERGRRTPAPGVGPTPEPALPVADALGQPG